MDQAVQMAGAVLILVGFVAAQRGRMSPRSMPYLVVNFVGSAVLFAVALRDGDWGFTLLEGVWALVSGWGLLTLRRPSASG